MPQNFMDFIRNYPVYAAESGSEIQVRYQSTLVLIRAAESDLGNLSRTFNDYPIRYIVPSTGETFFAINSELEKNWLARIEVLFKQHHYAMDLDKGGQLVSQKAKEQVQEFLRDVVQQVIPDFIPADTLYQLHPELIPLLHLETICNQADSTGQRSYGVARQLLSSYIGQVILSKLMLDLEAKCFDHFTSAKANEYHAFYNAFNAWYVPVINAQLLSRAIHMKQWSSVLHQLLLESDTILPLTKKDKDLIQLSRHRLCSEFIDHLKAIPDATKRLQLLDKVIAGQTPLGDLLIHPKSKVGFVFSTKKIDGKKVTGSIAELQSYRDTLTSGQNAEQKVQL